ncbi:hypothetical protein GJ744_006205 [Endocarpon pusillum]|uniref:Uncharacterized protein n=1 Tax=Endocarpon pusillum TaxID=364733 RepID=A0A8H7AK38_9EURO|nr:hypothetical protein GJ744_006205 [Endocarpon pusillum]
MAHTLLTTLTTLLFATIIYLLLSTLQIYDPLPSPSFTATTTYVTYNPYLPTAGNSTTEFLFKIGNLHIYGIRSLFIAVVVGVSFLSAMGVLYAVVALKVGVVRWDGSERWRGGGCTRRKGVEEWRTDYSSLPPPRYNCQSRVRKPARTVRDSGMQGQTRRAVPFRWRRTRGKHLPLHGREALMEHANIAQPSLELRRVASAGTLSGGISRYEIPSYYLAEPRRRSEAPLGTASADWRSSGIPSYYLTERDEDGRLMHGEGERPGFETRELKVLVVKADGSVPDALPKPFSEGEDGVDKGECVGEMMVRSLTGSTAVSEDGRRRSGLSGQRAGAMMEGSIGKSHAD